MSEQLVADLVVIGAGGAGLPAALTAQAGGLKNVVVLEKRPVVGGNAGMSGGYLFALNSEPQRRHGLAENSPDEAFRETMAYFHYDGVDPRLVRLWVDEVDRSVEWLENLGVGYRPWPGATHPGQDEDGAQRDRGIVVEPSGWSNHPGSFQRAMELMAERCVADGGRVLAKTAAKSIVPSDTPGVYRVEATGRNGDIVIETPRIVLASGGFTGNVDLLHEKFPGVYDESVYWTDAKRLAGDGIPLAEQVGADTSGRTFLIRESCYSFKTKKNKPNRASHDSPLWVNKYGERFLDETLIGENAGTNALIAQPGMVGYALFDDVVVQQAIDRPDPGAAEQRPGEDDPNTWTSSGFRQSLREQFADPANAEWCITADTWDEIAEWIGADPETLRATVDEYNRFCELGRDELWGKPTSLLQPLLKPPFSVLKFRPLMVDTAGPVRVDRELRVVDENGAPVPGVFAAGVLASGWIGGDEHRFGSPLSWAIASGRVAGEHAAAYVSASDTAQIATV